MLNPVLMGRGIRDGGFSVAEEFTSKAVYMLILAGYFGRAGLVFSLMVCALKPLDPS